MCVIFVSDDIDIRGLIDVPAGGGNDDIDNDKLTVLLIIDVKMTGYNQRKANVAALLLWRPLLTA